MQVPNRVLTALLLTVTLVAPAFPAAIGSADTCEVDASGAMAVGGFGLVNAEEVNRDVVALPEVCQGESFVLTGSNIGDDFDIDFFDNAGVEVGDHVNDAGDEAGTVPDDAVEARITYWAGAGGTYRLLVPAPTSTNEPGEDAVTEDTQLFLHSNPTGVGNVDEVVGNATMDPNPPTKDTPSVYNGVWGLSGSAVDAAWTWAPTDGFDFTAVLVDISFFTLHGGQGIVGETYRVELLVDGEPVAGVGEEITSAGTLGGVTEITHSFGPMDLKGHELTLRVNPWFGLPDAASAILYDSVDFPSGVDIHAVGGTLTAVTDLIDEVVGATHAQLSWSEAAAAEGVDHYRVYRDTGNGPVLVAEPEGTTYLDMGLSHLTSYTYHVSAVDRAGEEGPLSPALTVTTTKKDKEAPAFSSFSVAPGGTVITATWSTDEITTGTATLDGQTVTTPAAFHHQAIFTELDPGAAYSLDVTATDLSGNALTNRGLDLSTALTQTFYLHNTGPEFREFMNEVDSPGDNDGRGWNALGAALATVNHQTDTEVIAVRDTFPVEDPENPTVVLDASRSIEGTIYVLFFTSFPTAGTLAETGAGPFHLNLTLTANGGQVVASQIVEHTVAADGGWQAIEFDMTPQVTTIERGSLVAELRAEVANNAFVYGYEGDHASRIALPVQAGLPLQTKLEAPDRGMAGDEVSFTATGVGGDGAYTYSWSFSDGATATGPAVAHTFSEPGLYTATVTVSDGWDDVSVTQGIRVYQKDFVNDERVVVAVIDTGANPYHPQFHRPGVELPLDDFQDENAETPVAPRPIALTSGEDYDTMVNSYRYDRDPWRGIGEGELVWFEGTNVLGISFSTTAEERILDPHGHGTATSSTVVSQHPDAIIVMVQSTSGGAPLSEAIAWAANQSWIDVLSISWGATANAPIIGQPAIPGHTLKAAQAGKVVVNSAGNDPSPLPTDRMDGPPWVLSVTGSQQGGQGKEIMSSNVYPDYASNYTVMAANRGTAEETYGSISGTSFSCPNVAGVIAAIVADLRDAEGHLGGIQEDTVTGAFELAPGYTSHDVRAALNRTATLGPWDGYVAGVHALGDHTPVPGAEWTQFGWGVVDWRTVDPAVDALLAGTLDVPVDKSEVALYMGASYHARSAWFG